MKTLNCFFFRARKLSWENFVQEAPKATIPYLLTHGSAAGRGGVYKTKSFMPSIERKKPYLDIFSEALGGDATQIDVALGLSLHVFSCVSCECTESYVGTS